MEFKGFIGWFYVAADWVTRLAYINLLWIVSTILGGVVLGFMPATAAMFATVKSQLQSAREKPVFPTFFKSYKQEFWRSNRLGVVLFSVGFLLILDLHFFAQPTHYSILIILKYITLGIIVVYLFTVMYVFPVLVTYQMPLSRLLQVSAYLGATRPFRSIMMLIFGFIFTFILSLLHVMFILFVGSGLTLLLLLNAIQVFKTMDSRIFPQE